MKKMKILFVTILAVSVLFGCSKEEVKKKDELMIKTDLKNFDVSFYKNISTNFQVPITVVSNKKLDEKNISFHADEINISLVQMEDKTKDLSHNYYDYLVSKKTDWKQYATYSLSTDVKENLKATEMLGNAEDEYAKSTMDMEGYYTYEFILIFKADELASDEDTTVKKVIMKVNDKEFVLDVGNIAFLSIDAKQAYHEGFHQLFIGEVGITTYPNIAKSYNPSFDGGWQFDIGEDVQLSNIVPVNKNASVESVSLNVLDIDKQTSEKKYKGGKVNLDLQKGEKLNLNPTITIKGKNDEIIYHQSYDYYIEYIINGKKSKCLIESGIVNTTVSGYEILHEDDLKKEYQNYYFNYVNKVQPE